MSNEDEKKPQLLDSPHIGGLKMSSSLKERLKRSSRSFSSPVSRSVGIPSLRLEDKLCVVTTESTSLQNVESLAEMNPFSLEDIESCNDQSLLQQMHSNLTKQISENEKRIRELELVQHYHLKNEPDELVILIKKWLSVSQECLRKLYQKLPENKGDFQELLNMLNIDKNIIHYDSDSDTFS